MGGDSKDRDKKKDVRLISTYDLECVEPWLAILCKEKPDQDLFGFSSWERWRRPSVSSASLG